MGELIVNVLWVIAIVVFFWQVVLRVISKIGVRGPCPATLSWILFNPLRRRHVSQLLDRVGLQPGERVLELGPGPGVFTLNAALRLGPEGTLIAVDIQAKMIAKLERRLREAGLTNVETHVADAYDLPLNDAEVDRTFLITVLPEIPEKERALRELWRVLRPGGLLSVTEQFMDPDYPFPGTTAHWVESTGFEMVERHGTWWTYTLNFRKPE